MSWTWTKPACECVCPPPELTLEYKSATASSSTGDAISLVDGFDFSLIEWGQNALVFSGGFSVDGSASSTPNYQVIQNYGGSPPAPTTSVVNYTKVRMRATYTSNGLDTRIVLRTIAVAYNATTLPILPFYTYTVTDFVDQTSSGADGSVVTAFEDFFPDCPAPPPATPDFNSTSTFELIVGFPAPPSWSASASRFHGVLTKAGFHAYAEDGVAPPVIYRREALSGSFDGVQEWTYTAPPPPPPTVDMTGLQTFTTTIPGDAAQYASDSFPGYNPVTAGEITTPQQRKQDTPTGVLHANLSEEYTTADLVSQMDDLVSSEVLTPTVTPYGSGFTNPDAVDAINYTTPDETSHARAKINILPAVSDFSAAKVGDITLTFRYHKKVITLDTGIVDSDSDETVAVTAMGASPVTSGPLNSFTVGTIGTVAIDADIGKFIQITAIGFDPVPTVPSGIVLQYP